jgi:hypothetical protein
MEPETRASGSSPGGPSRSAVMSEILHLQRALEEMNTKISTTAAGNAKLEAENSTLAEYLDALMSRAVSMGNKITSKREAKVLRSNLDLAARRRNMELTGMAAEETSAATSRRLPSSPSLAPNRGGAVNAANGGDAAAPYARHPAIVAGEPPSLHVNVLTAGAAPQAISTPLTLAASAVAQPRPHSMQAPPPPPRMPPPPPPLLTPGSPRTPQPQRPPAHTPAPHTSLPLTPLAQTSPQDTPLPHAPSQQPHTPPPHTPPIRTPPIHTPPIHTPSIHTPPIHTPPVHSPAAHVPPAHTPPQQPQPLTPSQCTLPQRTPPPDVLLAQPPPHTPSSHTPPPPQIL